MNTQYKNDIKSVYNLFSKKEQKELYNRMQLGDQQAREDIICSCLPLVYDIASKFHVNNKHIDLEDLIQNGNVALIKSVDNWDINKAYITTVSTYYIRNALIDMVKDSRYNIKNKYDITRHAAQDIAKIKAVDSSDPEVIVSATGLTMKRVKQLMLVVNGSRTDYSLVNFKIHSSECQEDIGAGNINGCLMDIYGLLDEHIDSDEDRNIFLTWIGYINKQNNTKLTAEKFGLPVKFVSDSVRKTKRTLREACCA